MDGSENNKFLTVNEVAFLLRKKERTIREWCYSRSIPHYKVGNSLLFKSAEVYDWIDNNCRVEISITIKEIEKSLHAKEQDITRPKLHLKR